MIEGLGFTVENEMIVFSRTKRARPIVLTQHQIAELSEAVGSDVHARLEAMRDESFDAKTLGQLMRTLAARLKWAAGREHEASRACWCEPTVDYVDPQTGVAILVHRQVQ